MATKSAHEAAKVKAAKEKKILIALVIPLAAALFFAYQTVSKLHTSSAPAPISDTTPAAPVATGTPVAETISAALPIAPADSGKLSRTSLFASKDPFYANGPRVAASTGSTQTQRKQTKQKAVPPTTAVIAVNGRLALVTLGAPFPATKDPATNGVFRLLGLTAKTARISVVGGSYASGAHALTLTVDSVVTLVNTADGKKFTLVLYPQGTPAPGATTTTGP